MSWNKFKTAVDGNGHFTCLLDTYIKPGKKFRNNSSGFRNNNGH